MRNPQAVPSPCRALHPGDLALQDEEVSPSEAAQLSLGKRTRRVRTPQSFGAGTSAKGGQKKESAFHMKRSQMNNDEPTPPKSAGSTPPKEEEMQAVANHRRR